MKRIFLIVLIASFYSIFLYAYDYRTLSDFRIYAERMPELVTPDNLDLLHPDFTSFYNRCNNGWISRMKNAISIDFYDSMDYSFKQLLANLTERYKSNKDHNKYFHTIITNPQDTIVIWGDLQGAYHSFVRALVYWQEQGIIDNNLKILSQKHIFVINGNAIGRSAYSLETLTLILRLLEQNPDRVFYLAGAFEYKGNWRNTSCATQLLSKNKIITSHGSAYGIKIPLEDELDALFELLPLDLYLAGKDDIGVGVIRIAHSDFEPFVYKNLKDRVALAMPKNGISTINLYADIQGQSSYIPECTQEPLQKLYQKHGVMRWGIFSSPTKTFQEWYNFYFDACAVVTIESNMAHSCITSVMQDVRTRNGFMTGSSYNLKIGSYINKQNATPPRYLRVGASLDMQKEGGIISNQIQRGLSLAFNAYNTRKQSSDCVTLALLDDAFEAERARQNIKILREDYGVNIFLGASSTHTLQAYMGMIKKNKIALIFPSSGIERLSDLQEKNIIHLGPSIAEQAQALVEYMLDYSYPNTMCIIYPDDVKGLHARQAIENVCKHRKHKQIDFVAYAHNAVDFTSEAKKIKRSNADSFVFLTNEIAAREIIQEAGISHFANKRLYGLSDLNSRFFEKFYKNFGLRFTIIHMLPDVMLSDKVIAQEFREEALKNNIAFDARLFEAYVSGAIFLHILSKVEGVVTIDKVITACEALKNEEFKGLQLNFDPKTRSILRSLWVDCGDGREFKKVQLTKSTKEVR